MFREIVSASTSEAWIVLTPASIDKISKNACRHFAKKGCIHLPPLVTFTKPRARGFPLVDVWEAGKKSRSLSGIYCCRHNVKQDSVGDKFALTAWMISYRLSQPRDALCASSLGDFKNILSPSGAGDGADVR